jgi:DNA polymerase III, delta subunit
MAQDQFNEALTLFNKIIKDIKEKHFAPIYILYGEESYFSDIIISTLIDNVLTPDQRGFNQTIAYASDPNINADEIVSLARRYPVFSDYQLIIIKEAQDLNKLDNLEAYISSPLKETILVLSYSKTIDKRTSFYKKAKEKCLLFESVAIKEWKVGNWIENYIKQLGYSIDYDAAALIAEYVGNNLKKIALEVDKLIKSLPEDSKNITAKHVELNTGISREFSAFELCRAIGNRDCDKAYKIAHYMGENPKKYPIQMTFGALFFYFFKNFKMLRILPTRWRYICIGC